MKHVDSSGSASTDDSPPSSPRKYGLVIPAINLCQRTTLCCQCPILSSLENTPPPVSWGSTTPNVSRAPSPVLPDERKILSTPNVLNIHLNPINFRHLPLSKRNVTATMKMSHRDTTAKHVSSLQTMWGHIRKSQNSRANLIIGAEYEPSSVPVTCHAGVYGIDRRCFVDGKGFSRFLKQAPWPQHEHCSATATPSAPYSSSDLIGSYNNDTSRLPSSDDLRISNNGANIAERSRSYDTERRPSSRSKESRKSLSINSKGYENDRDREDRYKDELVQGPPNTNNHRQNYFKPIGLRNNYLPGQSPSASHINTVTPAPINNRNPPPPLPPARESEDLVAMGTNWIPNNGSSQKSNGGRPGSYSNNNNSLYQVPHTSSCSIHTPSVNSRRTGSKANLTGAHGLTSKREQEPKYVDPTAGAPPGLAQRIAEIAALESETIRWEKSRKVKKKVSRDY